MNANTNPVHLVKPVMQPGDSLLAYVAQHETLENISHEAYHADRSCVSSTALKEMLRSPAHFKHYLQSRRKETPSMFFGTAIHARLLEPHVFAQSYIATLFPNRKAAGYKQFAESITEHMILTQEQTRGLEIIAHNVDQHARARDWLSSGIKEQTLVWQDEETGIWLKIKPDCLVYNDGICLDVKSTQDASKYGFRAACRSLLYHFSAAMYLEGLKKCFGRDFDFAFLAIENDAPYQVNLLGAPPAMIREGTAMFREALRRLRTCIDTNSWPGFQEHGELDMLEWSDYYSPYRGANTRGQTNAPQGSAQLCMS